MSSLNQNVIRHKIGLLNLATELGNVSRACKLMGLSRDTFYRYQNAMADGGVEALFDANRRRPNPKNRVEEATEAAVLAYTTEQPAHGQTRQGVRSCIATSHPLASASYARTARLTVA
jgi:molybdenum-dependent DNA-binding transcriptional regulator ModE